MKKDKLHFGWYVVLASSIVLFFNAGARYAFGVVFKPIIMEYGWGRGLLSAVFGVNMVLFALGLLVVGKLYDRYGPKWVLLISTLIISLGFLLVSQTRSSLGFFISYGVLSALGFAGTSIPLVSTLVSKWFERKKGLATSLALAGGSLGHFALVPIVALVTQKWGWRSSFLGLGLVMFIVNTLLILWVIKGDPWQLALKPYGVEEEGGKVILSDEPYGLSLGESLRRSSLWFFSLMMFICGAGDFFSTTHLVPMAQDYGIPYIKASEMLGWYGLMSLFGLLGAGWLSDRWGCRIPIMLTFLLRTLLFLMLYLYKGSWSFYLFALAFGFTHLVTAPLTPVLAAKLYGPKNLGVITGLINTIHFIGGGFMAYLGGIFYDVFRNYQLALLLMSLLSGIAIFSTYAIKDNGSEEGRMKRFIFLCTILFSSVCPPGFAEVLLEQKIKVSEVQIFSTESSPQVLLSFAPGNLHFLDGVDLIVDKEKRVVGVNLYYRLGDGFLRSAFVPGFKGWMIKYPKDGAFYKEIRLRVITPDELFRF